MNYANRYPGAKKGYRKVYNELFEMSGTLNLKEYVYKTLKPTYDAEGFLIDYRRIKDKEVRDWLNSFTVGDLMDLIRKEKKIKFDQGDFTDFLYISAMGSLYRTRGVVRGGSTATDKIFNFLAKYKKRFTILWGILDFDIWPYISHRYEAVFKKNPIFKSRMKKLSIFLETFSKFMVYGAFPERYVQKAFQTHRCILSYNKAFTMRQQSVKDIAEDALDVLVTNPLRQICAGLTRTTASKFKKILVYMIQPETLQKEGKQIEREMLNIFLKVFMMQ